MNATPHHRRGVPTRAVHRWMTGVVLCVVRRPRLTLVIAGLLVAACAGLAAMRLTISTDQNELFSPRAPFFRDYLEFVRQFPENEALYALVEPANPAEQGAIPVQRWTAAADAITAKVASLGHAVRAVDQRVPLDQLGAQGLLFEDPDRLRQTVEEARRFVPLAQLWGEPPNAATALLGRAQIQRFLASLALAPADQGTAQFVSLLARSWTLTLQGPPDAPLRRGIELPDLESLGATDPSRLGYYYVPDETDPSRRILLIRIYPRFDHRGLTAVSDTVDAIRAATREASAAFPEFRVGLTGRPALEADEMRTTDRDSHRSEIAALIAVFIGLAVAMRSIWLAAAAEIALAAGIGWTFGWATLIVGRLNLLSMVFLIALIGIGMDYIVQVLARYRSEVLGTGRGAGGWCRVFKHVGPPINTACLGAAGAFLVSMTTDFRGAAELGIIAGAGLLLCLASAYTVLPALLTVFPARRPRALQTRLSDRAQGPVGRRPLLFPVLWLIALAAAVPFMLRARFDPGLLNLQAGNLESVKLVHKLQTWSAVVLSRDLDTLRQARDSLNGAATVRNTESILTVYDNQAWLSENRLPEVNWSPPTPVEAADVPAIARQARASADHPPLRDAAPDLNTFATALEKARAEQAAARLSAWQEGFVRVLREMLQRFSPLPLDLSALPRELRSHFVSDDGTFALYIHPRGDLWDRDQLSAFVQEIDSSLVGLPPEARVTGIAENIYHSTASIQRSFYQSTALALALIVVLVFIDLREVSLTFAAISVLALGLPMLVALMGGLGFSWNFANFFGLPILIGAGHEYGVFMVHRYVEARDHRNRPWRGWDVADRALLLCAFVTSSSFGFFWLLAHHRGLRSLGFVMTVGTACIYIAAVAVLRTVLRWRLARQDRGAPRV